MRATPFMLQQPLVFLDLETTGVSAAHDRIIEIGLCEVGGEARHRALGAARVIREFLRRVVPACSPAEVANALGEQLGVLAAVG